MRRYRQTFEEIIQHLTPIEASGIDRFAERVIESVKAFPVKSSYALNDLGEILDQDFEVGLTVFRLFVGKSEDEFTLDFKKMLGNKPAGVKAVRHDRESFLTALQSAFNLTEIIEQHIKRPVTFHDILLERLLRGRGRAIKGQQRGRSLEDFTEEIVGSVFGKRRVGYQIRCRFVGKGGISTEKADFAIPTKEDPQILIEAKAYGATGSKQTDILGDLSRINEQKRQDTTLLLVTDGVTWVLRANDLRKLIHMQNQGEISRIYTVAMALDLKEDLRQLKLEHGL